MRVEDARPGGVGGNGKEGKCETPFPSILPIVFLAEMP